MNAYELADGLSKMYIETDNHGLFNKRIQNMLRQQADRIAELEKECASLEKSFNDALHLVKVKARTLNKIEKIIEETKN